MLAGNLAGDGETYCATLIANGAVLPLTNLLLQARISGNASEADLKAAETAAWALSALSKHQPKVVSIPHNLPGTLLHLVMCTLESCALSRSSIWSRCRSAWACVQVPALLAATSNMTALTQLLSWAEHQLHIAAGMAAETLWLLTHILTSEAHVSMALAASLLQPVLAMLHWSIHQVLPHLAAS